MSPRVEEPEVLHSVYVEFRIAAEDGAQATGALMEVLAAVPSDQAYALGMRAALIVAVDHPPDEPGARADRWFAPN